MTTFAELVDALSTIPPCENWGTACLDLAPSVVQLLMQYAGLTAADIDTRYDPGDVRRYGMVVN